jgi:hypothetical protein
MYIHKQLFQSHEKYFDNQAKIKLTTYFKEASKTENAFSNDHFWINRYQKNVYFRFVFRSSVYMCLET